MESAITLDQLRVLVAVVEEGSFSAAARRLHRVQSAVSHAMTTLERSLDVDLWDRSTRIPTLTDAGRAVLARARRVLVEAEELERATRGMAEGLEPVVSICVDAVFPTNALVDLCRAFARELPSVELRVHTETLSAVAARVRDGTCQLGVVGPAADTTGLERTHITSVRMVPVVASTHPLASHARGRAPAARLAEQVQIVLSERSTRHERSERLAPLAQGVDDRGVLSAHVWRVVDLATKHALLLGGLGWGNMPEHVVRSDLARGDLVRLRPSAWGDDEHLLSLALVHRADLVAGPATRWLMARLPELCVRDVGPDERPRATREGGGGAQRARSRKKSPKPRTSAAPKASAATGRKASDV